MKSCVALFGSWSAAKEAAGFCVESPPKVHEVALRLRAWRLEHGRWPKASDYTDEKLPSRSLVTKYMGTVKAKVVGEKVEALLRGADMEAIPVDQPWTDEGIMGTLRDFVQAHGRLPRFDEIKAGTRFGLPPSNVVVGLYGTRSAAKIVAILRKRIDADLFVLDGICGDTGGGS